jgi:hypothetical protein
MAGKAFGAIGIVLILVGAVVGVASVVIPGADCGPGFAKDVNGQCVLSGPGPGGYSAIWSCNWVIVQGGLLAGTAHDAITEFPDAPFVAADGGTPDLNKVVGTPTINLQQKSTTIDVSIDDDVTPATAGYIDEDAYSWDARCILTNPPNAIGGGLQDVPIAGRISVSRVTGTNNNGTGADVFYCDVTAGTYLGFGKVADAGSVPASHTSDHNYVTYTGNDQFCPASSGAPLVGTWMSLGSTGTTNHQNGVYVAVFAVLHFGISDYTTPALGTGITIKVELGDDPTSNSWSGNVETLLADFSLLARA